MLNNKLSRRPSSIHGWSLLYVHLSSVYLATAQVFAKADALSAYDRSIPRYIIITSSQYYYQRDKEAVSSLPANPSPYPAQIAASIMIFCNQISDTFFLPWGCFIDLDTIGLPVTSRIHHNEIGCLCSGRQDEILLKHLDNWRTDVAIELLQVNPKCATTVILRLIDKWELGTTGWADSLQDSVNTWQAEAARYALLGHAVAHGRIEKRRKKSNKPKPWWAAKVVDADGRLDPNVSNSLSTLVQP
ncbi:hypothetical protein F5Y04DRAFT_240009 [Hypomontagnella monticulosa]|nr:hypothetical protein F5Y04DRAFT_240009 [Hypomontagnella monticulosa]